VEVPCGLMATQSVALDRIMGTNGAGHQVEPIAQGATQQIDTQSCLFIYYSFLHYTGACFARTLHEHQDGE
jgi:hypothetical protein